MMRVVVSIAAALMLLGSATAQPTSPTRIALVIGNSAYEHNTPLMNAVGDAEAVAAELRRLRFQVVEATNLDRRELAAAVAQFGRRLRAAGPEAVSFFYYAGHAAQDHQGINYLIPTDATTRTPEALRDAATPLQLIFNDINAANNPVNVVVLDACRNWYAGAPEREGVRLQGLRDMGEVANVFVGLSTAPGHTSDDGFGEHSPYTARLLEALRTRANEPLTLVFDDVQALVNLDTDTGLSPQSFNGLSRMRRWCLVDGPNCGEVSARPRPIVAANAYLVGLDRRRLLELTQNNVTFVDTLLARRDLLAANGIDSPRRLAHFLLAIGQRTDWTYRPFVVDLQDYHYSVYAALWSSHFPSMEAALAYAQEPERFMNRVTANWRGNGDEASGDGWRYRGRGLFYFVGRDAYREASDWVGVDLIANPELLADPEWSLALAAALWNRRGLNVAADAEDYSTIEATLSLAQHEAMSMEEVRRAIEVSTSNN